MVFVTIISKTGSLKETKFTGTNSDLYKKAGYRKSENFSERHTWRIKVDEDYVYCKLWAKDEGRAGGENKYDLPPPIDTNLFYGSMIASLHSSKNSDKPDVDLKVGGWKKVYEGLFGGFHDIDNEDSEESEDELESVPKSKKTKGGYLKDGFVVDSGDEDEDVICNKKNTDYGSSDDSDSDSDRDVSESDNNDHDDDADAVLSGLSDCSEESYHYSDEED